MVCGGGPYAQNQKIVTRVKAQRRGYKYNRSNIPGRTFSQRKELNDSSSGYSQWRSKSTEGKLCPKFYASSVIIAKNSCSLISPSWSRSNSSIIACLRSRMRDCQMTIRVEWLRSYEAITKGKTYSSSSSSLSPISFATRRRFRRVILPVLSSSKSWNARRISSIGSRANIRSLTVTRNDEN